MLARLVSCAIAIHVRYTGVLSAKSAVQTRWSLPVGVSISTLLILGNVFPGRGYGVLGS